MALIKCPECEQSISDKASKCPKCGYPIQEHLNKKADEITHEASDCISDAPVIAEIPVDIQQVPEKKKSKKNLIIAAMIACVAIVAVGVVFGLRLFTTKLTVESITISKWRLTDSTDYGDYYEGTITSEQKKPFIAVVGQYENEESVPRFVYVEDGVGVMETYENTDEDPSIKYRPIGYLGGTPVSETDVKIQYKDSDYYDWTYLESTNCDVLIEIDMNHSKTGLLVFDIINETNNEVEQNMTVTIVDGKAQYNYYAELPYKARGIDVSIVPKLFCESDAITQDDYVVEKAYTAEKNEGEYYTSYSGEEVLSFVNFSDGLVLYTRELKEGGNKEKRNVVDYLRAFLCDGECTLTTYDYVGEDEKMLMPKYEFNIVGYITWTSLEKETM